MKRCLLMLSLTLILIGCEYTDSEVTGEAVAETMTEEGFCNDLSGSWVMMYRTVTTPDSIYTQKESDIPTLKILNDTHWMFVRQSNDDEFQMARGGPYKLENGVYTEIVGYSSVKGNVGTVYTFECQLIDDSWYHKGQVGDEIVDEIWERVEESDEEATM